jgi:hypothetical protein
MEITLDDDIITSFPQFGFAIGEVKWTVRFFRPESATPTPDAGSSLLLLSIALGLLPLLKMTRN